MKKQILKISAISIALVIFLLAFTGCGEKKPAETEGGGTTAPDTGVGTTSEAAIETTSAAVDTTTEIHTTIETTTAVVEETTTVPEETTTVIQETTAAETTIAANVENPLPISDKGKGTVKSDTGTRLNLLAEWEGVKTDTDLTVIYKVNLYLIFYSLEIRTPHDGKLSIGDKTVNFVTPAISESSEKENRFFLAGTEYEADAGEPVSISATFAFNAKYRDRDITDITLSADVLAEFDD